MGRKSTPTVITPEIQKVIDTWNDFAKKNSIRLAPPEFTDVAFKAKVVLEHGGSCPCKRDERPVCPCDCCLEEIKHWGVCWCRVFCSQEFIDNPRKFEHETFERSVEMSNVRKI